ncbi:MAG: M20/M25/M40 family metallo-hydrolase, partial [Actinobacteria bacterium]
MSDLTGETVELLQAMIRNECVNDGTAESGFERRSSDTLEAFLGTTGLEVQRFEPTPGRASLVVRIDGTDRDAPSLCLMGHTDVVGVQREKWSVDPFAAVRKDGYIWGRGTGDDKDNATAGLMLLLLLKRQGVKLDRDVIFLAEGGEEGYSPTGVRYVIPNHWKEIDAEFVLAEGGGGLIKDGKVLYISVATSEKVRLEVQLIARGTAGHGSIPRPDSAVVRLANAISRIAAR